MDSETNPQLRLAHTGADLEEEAGCGCKGTRTVSEEIQGEKKECFIQASFKNEIIELYVILSVAHHSEALVCEIQGPSAFQIKILRLRSSSLRSEELRSG